MIGAFTLIAIIAGSIWAKTHRGQVWWYAWVIRRELLKVASTPGPFDSPLPEACVTDSTKTLTAEKEALSHRLPYGYRSFEIVPRSNKELRVAVPFQTTAGVERYVPIDRITEVWEGVLSAQRRDCFYYDLSVRFVASNGRELLTSTINRNPMAPMSARTPRERGGILKSENGTYADSNGKYAAALRHINGNQRTIRRRIRRAF
jgi:hypothetical protein